MTFPNPQPGSTSSPIDWSKPLFDNKGHTHTVSHVTQAQVLTVSRGFLFVWCRQTGDCMMSGLAGMRLTGEIEPQRRTNEAVTADDRYKMPESTNVIACLLRSSLREIRANSAARVSPRSGPVGS